MKKNIITIIAVAIVLMAAVTPFKWKQISDVIPTVTEINFVDGVTSSIQDQLNSKASLTNADTIDIESMVFNQELENLIRNATGIDYKLPMVANNMNIAGVALIDGRRYWVKFVLKESYTTTSVSFLTTGTTANYTQTTAGEKNTIYLYSQSGSTLTAIDSIANNRDLWKTAAGVLTHKSWKGGSHTLAAGTYAIGFIWTATTPTTAPTINILGSILAGYGTAFYTSSTYPAVFQNSQTNLPDTFDLSTLTTSNYSTGVSFMILKP